MKLFLAKLYIGILIAFTLGLFCMVAYTEPVAFFIFLFSVGLFILMIVSLNVLFDAEEKK